MSGRRPARVVLRSLWHEHRALLIAFGFTLVVTLLLTLRLTVHAIYWSRHRDEALAEWMTIGYVAQPYQVDAPERGAAVEQPLDLTC
ncbi:hypothetical protein [Amaricoccus solimangrovi]|uniref:Uncharacterized protein n=1 Tax=Amaricoccus solimangrovi TaxID=2589815 RepID=A0A501WV20_9RHOB|nr:hypothetical protein [Amaricoccus solimangrovi]TPE53258.1 hypothetical protein FJM51_04370 [Amaricoccus solimangrovi]